MRLYQWLITSIPVLVRLPPKSSPERDSKVEAGYLGGGPRKRDEVERWGREGRKAHRRCVIGGWVWTTVGNWSVAREAPLRVHVRVAPLRTYLRTNSCPYWGHGLPCTQAKHAPLAQRSPQAEAQGPEAGLGVHRVCPPKLHVTSSPGGMR